VVPAVRLKKSEDFKKGEDKETARSVLIIKKICRPNLPLFNIEHQNFRFRRMMITSVSRLQSNKWLMVGGL
jgi:hypothetical protein